MTTLRSRSSVFWILGLLSLLTGVVYSQRPNAATEDFRSIVEKKLKKHGARLTAVCPIDTDSAAKRIFADYGAIFLSDNGNPLPPRCVFSNEVEVDAFQAGLKRETQIIGGTSVTLQKSAMESLLAARDEALKKGLDISPRGGTTASTRTFDDTVRLWNSRFLPGLDHWVANGKITKKDADAARQSPISEQIKKVLEWERLGLYFSKDLSKSILYSVAAPGASQHIFMLALDVEQYANAAARKILASHGWFQTVKSDMPHFTYLGVRENELPSLGLKPVTIGSQMFWIPNID
jgi:hypothetical protein